MQGSEVSRPSSHSPQLGPWSARISTAKQEAWRSTSGAPENCAAAAPPWTDSGAQVAAVPRRGLLSWSDAVQGRWPPTEASWCRSTWVRAVRAARQVHVAGASTPSPSARPPPSSLWSRLHCPRAPEPGAPPYQPCRCRSVAAPCVSHAASALLLGIGAGSAPCSNGVPEVGPRRSRAPSGAAELDRLQQKRQAEPVDLITRNRRMLKCHAVGVPKVHRLDRLRD